MQKKKKKKKKKKIKMEREKKEGLCIGRSVEWCEDGGIENRVKKGRIKTEKNCERINCIFFFPLEGGARGS